jgi:precorrin-3B synthase
VPTPPLDRRAGPDACPGSLRLHAAADGPLARIRLPGGLLTGAQLAEVAALAQAWGDGHIELTSRANLQLRAVRADADELGGRLRAAGLLPSDTHETVRNILASPLSGRDERSRLDVRPFVPELDRRLCAEPRLADLPGRFLFALDDGRGDVADRADLAAVPAGDDVAILLAGVDAGLRVPPADTVTALLAAAIGFLDERDAQSPTAAVRHGTEPGRGVSGAAWRLGELVDGPGRVAARVAAALGIELCAGRIVGPTPPRAERQAPVGLIGQPDGSVAVGALVALGRLGSVPLKLLIEAERLVVTPWRGVVVPDLAPAAAVGWAEALAAAGLEMAPGSRWVGVTACAGRPGCAKALADVRADAAAVTEAGGGLPVHWIGCARGCGSPAGDHVRVEATTSGYGVTGPRFAGNGSAREVAALVAAARNAAGNGV